MARIHYGGTVHGARFAWGGAHSSKTSHEHCKFGTSATDGVTAPLLFLSAPGCLGLDEVWVSDWGAQNDEAPCRASCCPRANKAGASGFSPSQPL